MFHCVFSIFFSFFFLLIVHFSASHWQFFPEQWSDVRFQMHVFLFQIQKSNCQELKSMQYPQISFVFFLFSIKIFDWICKPIFHWKVLRQSIFTLCMPALSMLIQSPMFPHLPALLFFFSNIPALDLLRIFIFNYQTQFQPHKSLITSLP